LHRHQPLDISRSPPGLLFDLSCRRDRRVLVGIEISAGETVELKPCDFHIMFFELTRPIEKSAPVPVTLTFENAGSI
jgi:hypothetical protein